MDYKDILKRCGKTFLQAFVPALISSITACAKLDIDEFKGVIFSLIISALATGLCAVWNYVQQVIELPIDPDDDIIDEDVDVEDEAEG